MKAALSIHNRQVRRILHVDLDAFFVSVEQVLHPELRGKPVVVGGSFRTFPTFEPIYGSTSEAALRIKQRIKDEIGSRGVVASASYEARAYGLRAGMPLTTAYRLCPEAVFLKGSFPSYRDASARFMAILAEFTPYLEPVGIDEAYLDLTGFEPVYGSIWGTALGIKQRIKDEINITASVGIATSKLVAKIASDMAKPDGLLEVAPGEERLFLAPLPIVKLPCVGPKMERWLKGLGVTTIGELANLPVPLLRANLGALGEVIHRYALGIDERKVEPPQAAKSISRETTFIEDTLDHRFLKATLRYLSERVGAELRRDRRRARCITLKLRYADFDSITRSRTLSRATNADQVIFGAGVELLERALLQRRQLVRLIGIGVSSLIGEQKQLSLLNSSIERCECLDTAIDRIRNKYGFTAIQRGQSLRDIFPTENGDYVLATPSLSR